MRGDGKIMESRLSKDLYILNKEYMELRNRRSFLEYIKKAYKMLITGNLFYLLSILNSKVLRSKKKNEKIEDEEYSDLKKIDLENKKIAIYTCVIGKYDFPKEPIYVSEQCDYYIITDQEINKDSIWKKIDIPISLLNGMKGNELNRYIKLHPHEFFKEYEWSIYIDGNVRIICDLLPMVENMGESIIGVHVHNFRDCAYDEGKAFKHNRRLSQFYPNVCKQLLFYQKEGFPKHYGLYENTVLIRKHGDIRCINLMLHWWDQLLKFSFRDQISLPYIIWKEEAKNYIKTFGVLRENYRFRMYGHNE